MAFSQEAKAIIRERARDRCELPSCGEPESPTNRFEFHHKKLKGSGGTSNPASHTAANGAPLHGVCHRWVHDHPRQAREWGLIVSRNGAQKIRPWKPERSGV